MHSVYARAKEIAVTRSRRGKFVAQGLGLRFQPVALRRDNECRRKLRTGSCVGRIGQAQTFIAFHGADFLCGSAEKDGGEKPYLRIARVYCPHGIEYPAQSHARRHLEIVLELEIYPQSFVKVAVNGYDGYERSKISSRAVACNDDLPRVYPELFRAFQHKLYAFENLPYMLGMFGIERIIVVDVRRHITVVHPVIAIKPPVRAYSRKESAPVYIDEQGQTALATFLAVNIEFGALSASVA